MQFMQWLKVKPFGFNLKFEMWNVKENRKNVEGG